MKEEPDLKERTKDFALRIIRLFGSLPKSTEAQVLGKQLLRSGTSVGANYREAHRGRSKPEFHCEMRRLALKRWMRDPYIVDPVRAFVTSEAADRARWFGTSVYGGIFLDRCRLVDFCDEIDKDLLGRVKKWCDAARATVALVT